jgi:hypothetical protein
MLFNSLSFCLFFPLVTTLYFVMRARFRLALLLAASCVFYMAFIPAYLLVLGVTILIDYLLAIRIAKPAAAASFISRRASSRRAPSCSSSSITTSLQSMVTTSYRCSD